MYNSSQAIPWGQNTKEPMYAGPCWFGQPRSRFQSAEKGWMACCSGSAPSARRLVSAGQPWVRAVAPGNTGGVITLGGWTRAGLCAGPGSRAGGRGSQDLLPTVKEPDENTCPVGWHWMDHLDLTERVHARITRAGDAASRILPDGFAKEAGSSLLWRRTSRRSLSPGAGMGLPDFHSFPPPGFRIQRQQPVFICSSQEIYVLLSVTDKAGSAAAREKHCRSTTKRSERTHTKVFPGHKP